MNVCILKEIPSSTLNEDFEVISWPISKKPKIGDIIDISRNPRFGQDFSGFIQLVNNNSLFAFAGILNGNELEIIGQYSADKLDSPSHHFGWELSLDKQPIRRYVVGFDKHFKLLKSPFNP